MQIFSTIYGLVGLLFAPIINALTASLNAFLPVDIAKVIVVVGFYLVGLLAFKLVSPQLKGFFARLGCILVLFFIIVAGVSASDDHITSDSFLFGPYVDLIENYF